MTPYQKYITFPGSLSRTVQDWNGKDLSHDRWVNGLVEIVGLAEKPVFETVAEARMFFLYSLEYLFKGELVDPEEMWDTITRRVEVLEKAMPWMFSDEPSESGLTGGKPVAKKTKKKTQQECARDWWLANLEDLPGMKPKEIQDQLSQECDIHRNSCRGIYYKLKKELPFA